MKVLVIGPSDQKSRGGMATVIKGIRNSSILNSQYEIDIFPSFIDGNILIRLAYSIYGYLKFLSIKEDYDLFHFQVASFGSTFRKRLYCKAIHRSSQKVILHIHGAKYLGFYEKLSQRKQRLVREFLQSADMVLTLSDDWKNKFENTFGLTNCYALPNGIPTAAFKSAICDVSEKRNQFLFLGRLGERKGAYDLIEAVEQALQKNPEIRVTLAGDGEIEKVKGLIQKRQLTQSIQVVGWINDTEKLNYLKECATVVLPSYNEGLPMAILEGMAAGKAIISTTVGAIPEVITEENGILISPGDIAGLADAMIRFSTDPALLKSLSESNIRKLEAQFSEQIMHEKLIQYYHLVENKNGK